jgi:CheY-like chemotaxis protein
LYSIVDKFRVLTIVVSDKEQIMAKILVVDDDPDFVEITRIILENNGYDVVSASDSNEAIEKMRNDKPDLVLLDIMMSQPLDGVEVSKKMLEDDNLKKVPIIVVSSITDSPHLAEFPSNEYLPLDDWITKPAQPEDLLAKISKYLKRFKS